MNARQSKTKSVKKNQFRGLMKTRIADSKPTSFKKPIDFHMETEKKQRRTAFLNAKENKKELRRYALLKTRGGRNHWGRSTVKMDMSEDGY